MSHIPFMRMSGKIEMGKQYRTRDGREVRIYAVDGGGTFPVHGAVKTDDLDNEEWLTRQWPADGSFGAACEASLIEVKPTITRTYWLAHGQTNARAFASESHARNQAGYSVALTGPHTITFTEGEGLS